MTKATMSIREAADYLGISKNLMARLTREEKVSKINLGRRVLIPTAALELLLRQPDYPTNNTMEVCLHD